MHNESETQTKTGFLRLGTYYTTSLSHGFVSKNRPLENRPSVLQAAVRI